MTTPSQEPYGGRAPAEDEDTSREAANRIEPTRQTLRHLVLAFITACGSWGATDDEIEEALDMRHQTASARRRELQLMEKVFNPVDGFDLIGRRRPTRSGCPAKVWVSKELPK